MSYPLKTQSRMNVGSLWLTAALLAFGSGWCRAEPLRDGPYVMRSAAGAWTSRWVEGEAESPQVREQSLDVGDSVTVPAVGALPAFEVPLRDPARPAADEINVSSRTPLFVMADTHGEFDIAVQLLQRHRIIDDELRWAFGKGHLAILGDVFDRGPNHTELLWLIYKLEAEAARAGGGVHLAIGNHEAMVLKGDVRYLNPKYPRVAAVLGAATYESLWNEQSLLGQWLRSKAAVFRLGNYLCLHGGISRELVDRGLTLAEINRTVRGVLTEQSTQSGEQAQLVMSQLVMGMSGPLWYRGYFEESVQGGFKLAEQADIDLILERFKVRQILVGHTPVSSVTPLYGGRVIAVQVYPHRDTQTQAPVMEGVSIQGSKMFRARVDGSSEMLPRF